MNRSAEFRVLGPLEVEVGGRKVVVHAGKQRVLLASLLLRANRTVPITELIGNVWTENAPADARGTVQKYIMRLRRILADAAAEAAIRTEPEGYRIVIDPDRLDLNRFEDLLARAASARERRDLAEESAALTSALGLWYGVPPLSDVPSESLRQHELTNLVERYLQALERRIDVDLALGRHPELVGELTRLVREHPLRERFWAQRMRALHGAGRQGEALEAYREVARMLSEELGVDPGPELRAVHQEILRGSDRTRRRTASDLDEREAGADRQSDRATEPGAARPVRQLQSVPAGFVGRGVEIAEVVERLSARSLTGSIPLIVITGPAGVGKTTLALRAAHQVADRFPDGQLFVDLQGYSTKTPATVEEVLGRFLRALGVPPDAVPLRQDDQVPVYRSLLAGRRMLVVLDNARDEAQVRTLLPGSSTCAVLVTSRSKLGGLAVSPGGSWLDIGLLPPDEARDLLRSVIGNPRLAEDVAATDELIALCCRLPLALRLAAAHLSLRPNLPLADYVGQLRTQSPISALGVLGDDTASLATAFDWSYRLLPPVHRRLFSLLSVVPGPDFTAAAAAAIVDDDVVAVSARLEQLAAASLIERWGPRHFQLHDLLRAYAAGRCDEEQPAQVRADARRRLFDHYIAQVDSATQSLVLSRLPRAAPPGAGVSRDVALALLDEDRAALVAAVRDAGESGPLDAAVHLADALRGYFMLRGHAVDWLATAEAGLSAARQAAAERGEDSTDEAVAAMLNSRGGVHYYTGDTRAAEKDLLASLDIYERLHRPAVNALRSNLGILAQRNGDLETAIKHLEAALLGFAGVGDAAMEQRTRQNLVVALLEFGDLQQAQNECSLLARVADDPHEYLAFGQLAKVEQHTGPLGQAARMLQEAAVRTAASGDQFNEVPVLVDLAACYLEMGRDADAHDTAMGILARAERDDPRNAPIAHVVVAKVLLHRGRVGEARDHYQRALDLARSVEHRGRECTVLLAMAELELELGNTDGARNLAVQALALARGGMRRLQVVHGLVTLAASCRQAHELRAASEFVSEAQRVADDCHYPLGAAIVTAELGEIRLAAGDRHNAVQLLEDAEAALRRLGSRRSSTVQVRLESIRTGT